jgi:hypothetical protein
MKNKKKNKMENLLYFLTKKEYQILREFVLYLILRTDPKFHSQFIENFEYIPVERERKDPPKSTSFDIKLLEEEKTKKEAIKVTKNSTLIL